MNPIFDFFLDPYKTYSTLDILLEGVAVITGLLSVWFAKQDKVWVYPTGMISTAIYVYLLLKAGLLGDFLINAYYFAMSIYGWIFWTQQKEGVTVHQIDKVSSSEKKWSFFLFVLSLLFVGGLYTILGRLASWTAPIDTFTTALFFVGMWLMARRKIAHWIYWIVGDLISIPLYLYKGLALTSFQYLIFTLIAIFGYIQWKKVYNNRIQTV
jgi:nicotinamide mononucleotide transporter|tara:strand:+ start:2238 stop:2870 length:633 start_codon:yes stop_codon:yes gene_type:complete